MSINKRQLLNFLNGKSDPQESIAVSKFLKLPAGQQMLEELLYEQWAFGEDLEVDQQKLLEWRMEWASKFNGKQTVVPLKSARLKLSVFFRYAAVFTAVALGIGIYSVKNIKSDSVEQSSELLVQKNPLGVRSSIVLSDGSHVFLGSASSLSYPGEFVGTNRIVRLQGEAYFEVAKNEKMPFIIYTNNLRTQVVGTTFKISSFKAQSVTVAVTSGAVKVDKMEGKDARELALLNPGEQLVYADGKMQTSNFDVEDVKAWKKGELVFNSTSFTEVCDQISRWYGVTIDIRSKSLEKETITVTLDGNMPVRNFLKVLSASFGFKYTINNRHIIIY